MSGAAVELPEGWEGPYPASTQDASTWAHKHINGAWRTVAAPPGGDLAALCQAVDDDIAQRALKPVQDAAKRDELEAAMADVRKKVIAGREHEVDPEVLNRLQNGNVDTADLIYQAQRAKLKLPNVAPKLRSL